MTLENIKINDTPVESAPDLSVNAVTGDVAIRVQNLSKCYHIYDKPHDRLKQFVIPKLCRAIPALSKFFPTTHSPHPASQGIPAFYKEFWALKDVSFEIKKGETVGIIGRNGSGKSTLLQLICGTLNPTGGSIQTNGRVAALLELGSGFNPEFTGRENVYLNGAVLGLSKEEIDALFDEISSFADIGNFIEQPVKTYSSGMVVRLAFAVAINVEPDILIVDEALSVGDELFQRKCFSRIEMIRTRGATILFVSHSGGTIVELCDRAVLLEKGEKLAVGIPKQIVGRYQKLLYSPADKQEDICEQIRQMDEKILMTLDGINKLPHQNCTPYNSAKEIQETFDPNLIPSSTIEYESRGALIEDPMVITLDGEQVNNLIHGEIYCYTYTVHFKMSADNVIFGMMIKTTSGIELGGTQIKPSHNNDLTYVEAGSKYRIVFHFRCILNQGLYFLNAGVAGSEGFLHRLVDIAMFRVMPCGIDFLVGPIDFNEYSELELISSSELESISTKT